MRLLWHVCPTISTTYHFQSGHIRIRPRLILSPVWSFRTLPYAACCQCLPATYSASSQALSHFSPLINQVAETKRPKFTTVPRTCFVSGGCSRRHSCSLSAELRSIKSMYISAPNGLRVNGPEEDKEKEEGDVNVG